MVLKCSIYTKREGAGGIVIIPPVDARSQYIAIAVHQRGLRIQSRIVSDHKCILYVKREPESRESIGIGHIEVVAHGNVVQFEEACFLYVVRTELGGPDVVTGKFSIQ